jgi:putative solute:sodium symporter small subunit
MIRAVDDLPTSDPLPPRVLALKLGLLALWAAVGFGSVYFARDLDFTVLGWPFGYWIAAQGALLAFIAIVACYAWAMKRLQPEDDIPSGGSSSGG